MKIITCDVCNQKFYTDADFNIILHQEDGSHKNILKKNLMEVE